MIYVAFRISVVAEWDLNLHGAVTHQEMSEKTTSVQVLLHLKVQGVLDSSWGTLPFRRIGWGWVGVEVRRDWEEGWEG